MCYLAEKVYKATTTTPSALVVIALAHAMALFAAVSASIYISGGHVNPAITFGALLGGRISVLRAFLYWIAQLLAAIVGTLLLRLVTNGMVKLNRVPSVKLRCLLHPRVIPLIGCYFAETSSILGSIWCWRVTRACAGDSVNIWFDVHILCNSN